jgi:membrane-bound inhibitor of C-type lysozyme
MKKLLALIFALMSSFAAATPLSVNIIGDSPATYHCNNGAKVVAIYYELSDKSLQFVKLKVNKKTLTLPAVISGSGSRYSDSYKTEWWIKGNNATFNANVNNTHQKPIECKLIS